ncbi:peptidoglycan-binding protein [Streptomyces sp. NPDC051211]|uniref:peptidoglycan-binding protein n=1 Tax=Streptomyces sp. NPDC051211 TaxID=3154643 RepID=UPI003450F853
MQMPVFEEYEPAGDCACRGCVQRRRAMAGAPAIPLRDGGHPGAHGARRALVLATAAGVVLGGSGASALAAAEPPPNQDSGAGRAGDGARPGSGSGEPGTPQGTRGPLHGPGGAPAPPPEANPAKNPAVKRIDRAAIINRAKLWLDAKVPYSMTTYWSDGYRQDCSGYVSMAWNLGTNEWTGSLDKFATKITKEELLPGDMLLFHNPADPNKGSHVTLFGGWVDETRTHYIAYEQTRPATRKLATPYTYWTNAPKYLPYRFNGVTSGGTPEVPKPEVPAPATPKPETPAKPDPAKPSPAVPNPTVPKPDAPEPDDANPAAPAVPVGSAEFPGESKFGPGADNQYVAQLARMLINRGATRFYPNGPSTRWTDADRLATQAFQQAQGWTGDDADGMPGQQTWRLLVTGKGKDILPTVGGGTAPSTRPVKAPPYPGGGVFRPGGTHPAIEVLGRRLAQKGFGKHYRTGPGPGSRWTEADRRNVEAFQRAQGWRGAAADGYPGPETWRRLFA